MSELFIKPNVCPKSHAAGLTFNETELWRAGVKPVVQLRRVFLFFRHLEKGIFLVIQATFSFCLGALLTNNISHESKTQ